MKPINIMNKLNESSSIEDTVAVFGGPGSDFGVLYKEDVPSWKRAFKKYNIEVLNLSDDLTFTVKGKIKDIYNFYNNVVNDGSFGTEYNSVEEFAKWAGLLDQSNQDAILKSVPEAVTDETDWDALKAGLPNCKYQSDILDLMSKTMSKGTYARYISRFSKRQKPNSYIMYWPYSVNRMKEILTKAAEREGK